MKPLSLLLLILLCFTACQYAPYADVETTKKPDVKEVLGAYKFERQTVSQKIDTQQTRNASLTLNADSTFKATDLPNFIGHFDYIYKGNISTTGKWKIESVGSVSKGSGVETIWGIHLTSLPEHLQYMSFIGDKPPYKLLVTYGDPGAGAVMIFTRK